jgi:hypothetical protein
VEVGKHLIWLHTYGERFIPVGKRSRELPPGTARCIMGIPTSPEEYPEDFEYFETAKKIRVGKGEFAPVSPEVWNFSVSGLQVVKSWLDYRKKAGAGRRSSPLDDIRPDRWTAQTTKEFLELLWILEHTQTVYPELEGILDKTVKSDCFTAEELPIPIDAQRQPPEIHRRPALF